MRRIVDAHHHLWDLEACHYPWLMARGVRRFFGDPTPIQKNYVVEDLLADAADYDLAASVHVQVGVGEGDELNETAWLQATGDAEGLPSAIVAFCELDKPDALRVAEQHAAHSRVRGVRQIVGRSNAEDAVTGSGQLIDNPLWREHLAAIAEMGLSFDLQLTPAQVPRIAAVLAKAPGTRIVCATCRSSTGAKVMSRLLRTPGGMSTWFGGAGSGARPEGPLSRRF